MLLAMEYGSKEVRYMMAVILLWKLTKQVDLLPPSPKDLQFGRFLKNGLYVFTRVIAMTLCVTLAASLAARLGATPMAALEIGLQVWLTSSLLADGLAIAGQAILASAFAEKDYKKATAAASRVLPSGATKYGRVSSPVKQKCPDVNVDGDTALHLALKNGHQEVAYDLRKAGHKAAYMFNNDQVSPLRLAREAGFSEVLSAKPKFNFVPESALSDLEMDIVKRNLAGGRTRHSVRWDELYTAIVNGFQDVIVKELTRDGKELLLHQRHTGETLLHVAAAYSRLGPLRQLVNFMINNNLHHAALLRDRFGDTALHRAVERGSLSAAHCLIKAVPETVYKVNDNGVSPLYLAVKAGRKDLVIYMMSHCRLPACATEILAHHKHKTLAHLAITARSFGTLKTLMEHLPELIKMTDEKGWRPLSYAANKGYVDEVTYFLTHFPKSVKRSDIDGFLPIHKAISGGYVSVIKAFVAHCPQELYRVDKKGRSVLHIAVLYKDYARDDDILAYLMKEVKMDEAFLNLQDNEGKTFRDYAKDIKHSSSISAIRCKGAESYMLMTIILVLLLMMVTKIVFSNGYYVN